jgi:hypothetical protein
VPAWDFKKLHGKIGRPKKGFGQILVSLIGSRVRLQAAHHVCPAKTELTQSLEKRIQLALDLGGNVKSHTASSPALQP